MCFSKALIFLGLCWLQGFAAVAMAGSAEPLDFLLNKKTSILGPHRSALPLMGDYQVYWRVKAKLTRPLLGLSEIENAERELLTVKMVAPTRSLRTIFDEFFFALEIRRAEALVRARGFDNAVRTFHRAIQGLPTTRWPLYWRAASSDALHRLCVRDKKNPDRETLLLAKRIVEVFPKGAAETLSLRNLLAINSVTTTELSTERLSQTYSEKIENDEIDFGVALEAFLSQKYSDVPDLVRAFLEKFPRSILRFRAHFLMAESYYRRNKPTDADPSYRLLLKETPLSFYAIVSANRLGIDLKQEVKQDPILIVPDNLKLNFEESLALRRIEKLVQMKKPEEVGFELESIARYRSYSKDTLHYLMGLANRVGYHLGVFKIANEFVQRDYASLMNRTLIEMIFPFAYEKDIQKAASDSQLDAILVQSLTKQESGFKYNAISSSGALGLMQLMPFTALDVQKDLPLVQALDPKTNLSLGTRYIASVLARFQGNVPFALAGYNAGPHRAVKWKRVSSGNAEIDLIDFIESIPFKETRDYVMAILRNRYWYEVRKGLVPSPVAAAWKNMDQSN
jgi:hypothetical protein